MRKSSHKKPHDASKSARKAMKPMKPKAALSPFFEALPDAEFFGPSVQHVYLYGEVNNMALLALRRDIDEASKGRTVCKLTGTCVEVEPKPIVVHINSPGGGLDAGLSMMSIFHESRVDICACVDGISISAATFLSVIAPYRVMVSLGLSTIHAYSSSIDGRRVDVMYDFESIENTFALIRDMYLERTRIPKGDMDVLLARDLYLTADKCLEYGLCDRVLKFHSTKANPSSLPEFSLALKKTNLNHVRFSCAELGRWALMTAKHLDALLDEGPSTKAIVIHADSLACLYDATSQALATVTRMQALSVPTYGIIDTDVSLLNALPILVCKRRAMYAHAVVNIKMTYSVEWGAFIGDIVANTGVVMTMIRQLLKKYTKLPPDMIEGIDRHMYRLGAKECLEYGLVDEIIAVAPASTRRH